ncbi:holin [Acinetobacter radioresistens]|nr:holin [Acinetobacter radioresistens]ENV87124.1 hypothetical protein F940_01097 [Acinetobacter radioresistens NIPH 2130]MBA5699750.1 hypothetical protein [Acinetobacter radioresistens]MCK4092639.1 hypothetical protein [Acinetobacter radioresistens]MCK4104641.1 hypothetical protein [Acinetobacter radioresistens]MCK4109762.1 hypothetical protein [Acinetobacter radioresistens]
MSESKAAAVMEMAATVSSAATKTTYFGGASSFFAFLISNQVIAVLGVCIALGGFIVNWYYKRLENRRADELHKLQMKKFGNEL